MSRGVSTGCASVLQDARAGDRLGIVDALAPMVYWPIAPDCGDRLDFAWLADEHANSIGKPVFVGTYVPGLDGRALAQQVERQPRREHEGRAGGGEVAGSSPGAPDRWRPACGA